jgi:hypothetical protein
MTLREISDSVKENTLTAGLGITFKDTALLFPSNRYNHYYSVF